MHRLRRWFAELILVFISVYAAFWLNNYQEHSEERRRHDQILAALEDEVSESIQNDREQIAKDEKAAVEFRRALDAGEMPPVRPFSFATDYSPTDIASLLQAGGYQLLDAKTIIAIRKAESSVRAGLSQIAHIQKLSDEQIVPNLDQDISFFYDPATRKLRKRFADYPEAIDTLTEFFKAYAAASSELLAQLKAERQRR